MSGWISFPRRLGHTPMDTWSMSVCYLSHCIFVFSKFHKIKMWNRKRKWQLCSWWRCFIFRTDFFRTLTQKDLEYPAHIMSAFISEKAGPPCICVGSTSGQLDRAEDLDEGQDRSIPRGIPGWGFHLVLLKEFMQMLSSNCLLSFIQSIEHIFIEYLTYIRH